MNWRVLTVSGYLVVLVSAILLMIASHLPSSTIPTFGSLMSRIMRTRSGRIAVLVGWLWLGMHFFAL
ncbi:MAG TPA: DUF6186 family protein [Candidatus Nanopelagicales bacterium]